MIDRLVIDEMTVGADRSYLRFDADEWYLYHKGNIVYVETSDWLEQKYQDLKNNS